MRNRRPLPLSGYLRPPALDPASRRTVVYFALKLGVILGFAIIGAALCAVIWGATLR